MCVGVQNLESECGNPQKHTLDSTHSQLNNNCLTRIDLSVVESYLSSTLSNPVAVEDNKLQAELTPLEKLLVDQMIAMRDINKILKSGLTLQEKQKEIQKIQSIVPINNGGGGFASGLITGENLGGGFLSGLISGLLAGFISSGGGFMANPNWTGAYSGTNGYLGPSTGSVGGQYASGDPSGYYSGQNSNAGYQNGVSNAYFGGGQGVPGVVIA
ncbi:hypothetical protein PPL_09872 [Heterostelium album PN500]|uniref:Uncharacterized protein n=1 Tax=Heterostelium pallidum (strain ATCC 26659 / Pp 5 / PN500) TaxID=670386 RepID=D3BPA9_HETP5|nr:hypothetical protein PPL_09872 [Heterostelium album PN500]EFA77119.1 hypothetical protein PPL_09872 [Heterostelium album PN500]|eukprot:XP_020429248.1 hypothetical protein PPL_09872 [Heterostelium album PN500]